MPAIEDRPRRSPPDVRLRSATPSDQAAIDGLVKGERLNPNGLVWRNFMLAFDASGLVGAAQLRPHGGGVQELGSLVVRSDRRGQGIAARLIESLLDRHPGRVLMITRARFAAHYARWSFERIPPCHAPASVMRNYLLGQVLGSTHAVLHGRKPARLAVLECVLREDRAARRVTSNETPAPS